MQKRIKLPMDKKILGILEEESLPDWECLESLMLKTKALFSDEGVAVEDAYQLSSALKGILAVLDEKIAEESSKESHSVGESAYLYVEDDFMPRNAPTANQDWLIAQDLNRLAYKMREKIKPEDLGYFNMDGIYPGYAKAPLKILFVAREAYGVEGLNYMRVVGKMLQEGKFNGWTLNQYPFHRRQFYIAYGIKNDFPEWNKVPYATQISKDARFGGSDSELSWAFMNMCKISNKQGNWQTDCETFRKFIEEQADNLKEEIKILNPDLIIGSGVYDLVKLLGYKNVDKSNKNCFYWYNDVGDIPPMLDCYHFSAIKSDQKCYYEAVRDVFRKHR